MSKLDIAKLEQEGAKEVLEMFQEAVGTSLLDLEKLIQRLGVSVVALQARWNS